MKAVIDRIEGDLAVVLLGENGKFKLNIPITFLPADCKEGDVLKITIERDMAATEQTKERVSSLMEKLKKKGQSGMIKGQE
jgi:hypothetical protein